MTTLRLDYLPVLGKSPSLVPISNSEIGTYKECKRKWWLSYYLGLNSNNTPITGPLAFGTRMHMCMEELYKNGTDPIETHDRLLAEAYVMAAAMGYDASDLDSDAELGRIMLEGYMEWLEETGADSDLIVTDSEKKLTMSLLDGKVEVRGKLDLRVRRKTDGARRILDFKTLAQFPTYTGTAHIAEQLKLYILLEQMNKDNDEDIIDGAIYRLMKKVKRTAKAKPPFYVDFEVRHNKKTIESFWYSLHGTLVEMLKTREYLDAGADPRQVAPPTPTRDCTWKCPFFAGCPMVDDGSAIQDYLSDNFTQHDPYERYEEEDSK